MSSAVTETPRATASTARSGRVSRILRNRFFAPVLLIIATLLVSVVHVPQHDRLSPIDEYVYVDYMAKVGDQGVVRHGEKTGWFARNYFACHGVEQVPPYLEYFCDSSEHKFDKHYPIEGYTSADIYTPVYFVATWVMAQPLMWTGVGLVDASRFTGIVWLIGAVLLLFFTMRRLRIPDYLATGIGLALVGSVPAFWSNTYISTDAPSMLAGALLLYLLVRFGSGKGIGWGLVIASTAVVAVKFQNLAAVGAAVLYLLILVARSLWDTRAEKRFVRRFAQDRRVWTVGLMLVFPVIVQASWLVIRSKIDLGTGGSNGQELPLTIGAVFRETFKFFGAETYDPSIIPIGAGTIAVSHIVTWLSVAGVLGIIATAANRSTMRTIAFATLGAALLLGPALAVATAISGAYFSLPPRYYLPLLPLMMVCAAGLTSSKKHIAVATTVICVLSYLLSLTIGVGIGEL